MLKRCILAENRKLHASPIWAMFIAEGEILLLELHQRVIVLLLAVILVLLLTALNLSGYRIGREHELVHSCRTPGKQILPVR